MEILPQRRNLKQIFLNLPGRKFPNFFPSAQRPPGIAIFGADRRLRQIGTGRGAALRLRLHGRKGRWDNLTRVHRSPPARARRS